MSGGRRHGQAVIVGLVALCALALPFAALGAERITLAGTYHTFTDGLDELLAEFARETGIEVEKLPAMGNDMAGQIVTMAAGGVAPDVLYSHSRIVKELSELGLLRPLDDLVARDGIDLGQFAPLAISYLYHQGRLYALPSAINPNPFYTNNTLLDQAGVDRLPTAWDQSWTFGDFVETLKKLTRDTNGDGTSDVYGFSNGTGLDNLLSFFDLPWTDETRTRFLGTEPAQIEAMTLLASLSLEHGVVNPGGFARPGGFRDGGSAIAYAHGGEVNTMVQIGFPNWSLAAIPFAKKTFGTVHNFAIYRDSAQADAAWKLVTYLTYDPRGNEAFAKLENRVPALRGMGASYLERISALAPGSRPEVLLGAVDHIWHHRLAEGLNGLEASTELTAAMEAILDGRKSVEAALTEAKPVIEGILRR